MGFNRYVLNIIIRSIFLAITALVIAFFAINIDWIFTLIFLCLIFILQIYLLIKYATKINRDLANFLIHIKEQDTSLTFSRNTLDKTFNGLTKEFENINTEFKKIKDEKIKKQNLLNILLDRVGTGILVINSSNEIKLFNRAINNILGVEDLLGNAKLKEELYSIFNKFDLPQAGEQKIVTIHVNNITRRILIALSEIKEDNDLLKIYSFHDIDREMTDYELQSWNGIIKVLSHEIMNTLTPMSTVIDTLNDCMTIEGDSKNLNQLEEKDILDSVKGIKLLENRINGLKDFIVKFRQFSDIPPPELNEININNLLKNIVDIYESNKSNIRFTLKSIPESLCILADKELIELVFNNIIKNAIEALIQEEDPQISLKVFSVKKHVIVEIWNNGQEIESSVLKKVFLPFYTTKNNGSGIGLSLARQIMFSHGGNIELKSNTKGTCVKLFFNKIE